MKAPHTRVARPSETFAATCRNCGVRKNDRARMVSTGRRSISVSRLLHPGNARYALLTWESFGAVFSPAD